MAGTQYTNSVAYLLSQQWLEADAAGYINEVLYGVSPMGIIPIVPTSHFMRDEYFTRGVNSTKLTQKRKLNEMPDATSGNPFKKNTEHTSIYFRRTDIDTRLAKERPGAYDEMLLADAKDMVMDIDYDIFNGVVDSTGYGLSGLKDRIAIGSSYDVNNAGVLTINTSATTMKTFLRKFREARDLIKMAPGMNLVAFCNKRIHRAITSGRDELGANVAGFGYMDILNNRVTTIDDVPLLKLEGDSVNTQTLAFDENGESSTSMFICGIGGAPAEGSKEKPNGLVIVSSDQVIDKETAKVLGQIQTKQEMDIGLRVPAGSVARLSRLKDV